MHVLYTVLLLICVCAGIIAEIITISAPEKIIGIIDKDPEDLLHERFYRILIILSSIYVLVIILLFFSGNHRFRIYGTVILVISLFGWIFRSSLKKHTFVIITESTISLIILIDIVRTIIGDIQLTIK